MAYQAAKLPMTSRILGMFGRQVGSVEKSDGIGQIPRS